MIRSKNVWVKRDGTPVRVRDMGNGHLINTIKMLVRQAGPTKLSESFACVMAASRFQGEMAQDACESESRVLDNMSEYEFLRSRIECWETMVKEAVRRGVWEEASAGLDVGDGAELAELIENIRRRGSQSDGQTRPF